MLKFTGSGAEKKSPLKFTTYQPTQTEPYKIYTPETITPVVPTSTQTINNQADPFATKRTSTLKFDPITPLVSGAGNVNVGVLNALRSAEQLIPNITAKAESLITGKDIAPRQGVIYKRLTKAIESQEQARKPFDEKLASLTGLNKYASGAIQSLPQMLPALVGASQASALGSIGASAFGSQARESEKQGANYLQQVASGIGLAGTEIATEALPLQNIMKFVKGKGQITDLVKNVGQEFLGEATAQAMQPFIDSAYNRNAVKDAYTTNIKQTSKDILDAGLTGSLSALLLGGTAMGINTAKAIKNPTPQNIEEVVTQIEQVTQQPIDRTTIRVDQAAKDEIKSIEATREANLANLQNMMQSDVIKPPTIDLTQQPNTIQPTQEQNVRTDVVEGDRQARIRDISIESGVSESTLSEFSNSELLQMENELKSKQKPDDPIIARANEMLYELQSSQRGYKEPKFAVDPTTGQAESLAHLGGKEGYRGVKRSTTNEIANLLDVNNFSYDTIETALNNIIKGKSTPVADFIKEEITNKIDKQSKSDPIITMNEDIGLTQPKPMPTSFSSVSQEGERKTYGNSLKGAVENGVIKQEVLDTMTEEGKTYMPTSNEVQWAYATDKVNTNPTSALSDFMTINKLGNEGKDTAVAEALIKKFSDDGNFQAAADVATKLSQLATEAGQAIQAISILKRLSPEGMIYYANKQINDSNDSNQKAKADELAKQAETIINNAEQSALNEVLDNLDNEAKQPTTKEELTNAERLAKNVTNTIESLTKSPRQRDVDIVQTLAKITKEKLPTPDKVKKSQVENIQDAIMRQDTYQQVWQDARDILNEQYANSSDLDYINDIFDNKLRPTFSQNTLDSAIKEVLTQNNIKLSEIIKAGPNSSKTIDKLVYDSLIDKGFSDQQAKYLRNVVNARVKELTKESKAKALEQLFKEKKVSVKKSEVEKLIELVNIGGFENGSFRNELYKKLGINSLTNQESSFIVNTMKEVQSMENGQEKDIKIAQVLQTIANKIPSTFTQKQQAIRRMTMLLNPKTQVRNIVGNAMMTGAENASQVVSANLDKAISLLTGERKTLTPQIKPQLEGAIKGFKDALTDYKLGIDTSASGGGAYEVGQSKKVFNNEALNKTNNFLSFIMTLGDRPFYQAAYNGRIAELEQLGVTIDDDAKLQAHEFALDRVFQNDTEISKAMSGIKREMNRANIGGFGFGDAVIPFTKTPSNILRKGVQYTPLGVLSNLKQIKTGFDQKSFTDSIGRSMVGSSIMTLGYLMAKAGLATGDYDKNKDKEAAETLAGETNYSLKIGDKYYSFDWAQPISIPLAIGIDFYKAKKSEDDLLKAMNTGFISGAQTLFKQSLLQGLSRMLGGYNQAQGIADTIANAPSQYIPTILGQVARTIDPLARDTDALFGKTRSKLPLIRQTLKPKLDVFGEPIKANQGRNMLNRALENFLLPNTVSKANEEQLSKELLRLTKLTDETGFLPNVAPNSFQSNGTITLTPDEKTKFQETMGNLNYEAMNQVINSNEYKLLSNTDKAKILSKINSQSDNQAKQEVIENRK